MKKQSIIMIIFLTGALLFGCSDTYSHSRGVYMLLDTSGTYKNELIKARAIINYLLGTLQTGDFLGVARIDTGSFSERDIIAKAKFDRRPSVSNTQKRMFRDKIDQFLSSVNSSPFTDVSGGVLQAVEYLNEINPAEKYVLIFSDLKEELVKGYVRDFPIQMDGLIIVALNVTKLRSDNIDPREYLDRLDYWKRRVEEGGGRWRIINDLERLDEIMAG
jgi:hypothetical protein